MHKQVLVRQRRVGGVRFPRALWLVVAVACALAVGAMPWAAVRALADDSSVAALQQAFPSAAAPEVSSPSAFLIDRTTGAVLMSKDADEQRAPASTTKIMTALVVLEHANLDDMVTTQATDFDEVTSDSSTAGLRPGETLSVRDLLACLLVPSGNDAAYILARYVGGDTAGFVQMMNDKAAELGCTNTHFSNPSGLPADDHYTTAHDLAVIMEAALDEPDFTSIAKSETWDLPATEKQAARTLTTTDYLLKSGSPTYMGDTILAAKTGYTESAGKCLVAAGQKGTMSVVGVVMGASNVADAQGVTPNFYDMKTMLEWAYDSWKVMDLVSAGQVVGSEDVRLSKDGDSVQAVADSTLTATVPAELAEGDIAFASAEGAADELTAPVEKGASLGDYTVSVRGFEMGRVGTSAASTMELSVPAAVLDWLSDPLHLIAVIVVVVAVFAIVGLLGARASANRRARRRARSGFGRSHGRYDLPQNRARVMPQVSPERPSVRTSPRGGVQRGGTGAGHATPRATSGRGATPYSGQRRGGGHMRSGR